MSLALAIALNVVLDIGIIALLAYAMTRPASLRPHTSEVPGPPVRVSEPTSTRQPHASRRPRAGSPLAARS